MNSTSLNTADETFLSQFEDLSLDASTFDHEAHLRLAWLYLQRFDFDLATDKVVTGIRRFAANAGAHDKFHFTITVAMMCIVNSRMTHSQHSSWQEFLNEHADLKRDALGLLNNHFSEACLFSDRARNALVEPDRKPWSKVG